MTPAVALELGFHAEHSHVDDNVVVITRLLATEAHGRPHVGDEAEIGVMDHDTVMDGLDD